MSAQIIFWEEPITRNLIHLNSHLSSPVQTGDFLCYFLVTEQESNQRTQLKGALRANAMNSGMLATGKHRNLDSLRGAPPPWVSPRRPTGEFRIIETVNRVLFSRNCPDSSKSWYLLRANGRKSGHFRLIVKVLGPFRFRRGGTFLSGTRIYHDLRKVKGYLSLHYSGKTRSSML